MGWFEKQVNDRRILDEEELEEAFAKLAASVTTHTSVFSQFGVDELSAIDVAIEQIMTRYGLKPGEIPEGITNPSERLDYTLRTTGVMTRSVRLIGPWWKSATGAYLGRLKGEGVPVALLQAGIRGYAYVDPATHKKVYINKNTSAELEEDALCFYRPLSQESITISDVLSFILNSLGTFDCIIIILATLVATLAGMAPTVGIKLLFSTVIPSQSVALIMPIAVLFLGMTVSQTLFKLSSSMLNARIAARLKLPTEAAVYARIMLLNTSFFKGWSPGDITQRMLGISPLISVLSMTMFELCLTGLMSLLYVLQILLYAPSLAIPALVTFLIEILVTVVALKVAERYNQREMVANAKLSGVTPEVLHGIQKIKVSGAESRAFAYWADRYADVTRARYGRPPLLLSSPLTIPLIASIGTIFIYSIAVGSSVATDDFMAFNYAFGAVSGAVGAIAANAPTISTILPRLELLEPILAAEPESLGNKKQVDSIDGSIEIRNLSFRYDKDLPLILDNVSLSVRPGEYVAIVGSTGCGKSTLMRLLLGFERPTWGSIHYGVHDLADVDVRSLRRSIGVVMQNGTLFVGDLLANIIVSSPGATLDDAWEAAELASIADDIRAMPMGMHTIVSEGGGGFSGGQRQRLMIARAVCGKPRILMLDEATSALDNVAQRHVSDALEDLNCTRLVIAHRLSTIRACDRIIMLDGGHIVEEGSYDELVVRGGPFAKLVERQRVESD